jgi:hypothetical protein
MFYFTTRLRETERQELEERKELKELKEECVKRPAARQFAHPVSCLP